jgi:hypothetical protein
VANIKFVYIKEYSMKKVALSLIALLAAGTFAFAEDVAVEKAAAVSATLSADAKVKFGVDLDTMDTGFSHSEGFDLELVIIPESDSSKAGTGDVYGTITIEDVKIAGDLEDGDDSDAFALSIGDIVAKIVFPNGYFKINENTDSGVKYGVDGDDDNGGATIVADDAFYTYSGKYGDDDSEWTLGDIDEFTGAFDGSGVEVYYELPGLVGLTGTVASNGAWSDNTADDYEFTGEVSLKAVEKLTLKAKVYSGYVGEDTFTGFGGELAYDLGVAVPFASVNYMNEVAFETTAAVNGPATLTWDDEDGDKVVDEGELTGTYTVTPAVYTVYEQVLVADFGAKLPLVDGFNAVVAGTYGTYKDRDDPYVNAVVTLSLPQDKLIGPFSALAGLRLKDALSTVDQDTSKTTEVFYKVAFAASETVSVWTKGSFNSSAADDSDSLFVKAGVDYTGIPLTTLGAEYDSSDLGGAKAQGDNKAGQFYVYAKVAY